MSNVQNLTVTGDEDGIRLDRWFKRHFPDLGHGRVEKLLRTGQEIVAVSYKAFEVYLAVAVVYLVMTLSIAKGLRMLENHLEMKTKR